MLLVHWYDQLSYFLLSLQYMHALNVQECFAGWSQENKVCG